MMQFLKDLFSTLEAKRARVHDHLQDGEWHSSARISKELNMQSCFMYPALASLEGEGHIESTWETPSDVFPRRRVYRAVTTTLEQP